MSEPITFMASFPAIQAAIKVGDDGMRIQLHIPESEMENALWLIAMREKRLKVTVEIADDVPNRTPRRRKAGKRKQ